MRVMRQVWEENYCVFGVRKMHAFLNTHELGVGYVARCTVERLMRRMGIRGVSRRRTRHVTASAPRHACPLDLVNRHFGAHDLNELWVADITYVPTQAGWVYVAFVTDVCSRKILGWKVASSLHTDVALDALNMAIYQRRRDDIDTRGLVHHSDRGVQYCDVRYGQALACCQAVASVGSTGDSYDNALAEALNSLYKAELIYNTARPGYTGPWRDRREVEREAAAWVHWYNTRRPLSLGGITPQQVESQHTATRKEAASTSLHKTQDLTLTKSARTAAPVTWRCTRYVALHPLCGAAPEQKGCNAYGSGAAHPITRTNAESARRPPARRRYVKEQNVLVL